MAAIRFLLNGEAREETTVSPTMMVMDWLRTRAQLTGTKEGCREGDCGACTIGITRIVGGRPLYQAMNSCLMVMPQLDGASVLTVEGLATFDRSLHAVQQALVDADATQCGFCTPGFVMALLALYHDSAPTSDETIHDCLAGNLCRCTGYRPIVDAARGIAGQGAASHPCHTNVSLLASLDRLDDYQCCEQRFIAPATADDLARALHAYPDALLLAGGTDLGIAISKNATAPPVVVSTARVGELQRVVEDGDSVVIGGAATYSQSLPAIDHWFPSFGALIRRLGSRQIRNLGTIAGNVVTASPIGDTLPVLMVLGASVTLRSASGKRTLQIEDFITGYRATALQRGEFIETIRIPKLKRSQQLFVYKLSKRFDQDISTIIAAFVIALQDGTLQDLRAYYGGMADRPKRARTLESSLIGRKWTLQLLANVETTLAQDFTPVSDHRGSSEYRLRAAGNLVRRLFHENHDATIPLRVELL
ncbi:MAG TPA: xanthine dehydrogenase small subunit [Burkholderiales bacterium]|nr:xanthine dehydrogenase small subunit [Burkholderiales bacterium]